MSQLSSYIRPGLWFCALGALALSAGCGSITRIDGASEATGSGGSGGAIAAAGSGGAGGTPDVPVGSWSRAFDNAYPYSVAADPSGNILVGGYFRETMKLDAFKLVGGADREAFLVKFDP